MLHLAPVTAHRVLQRAMVCLLLSAACKSVEPPSVSPPLRTDKAQYVLGASVWNAPMRVSYTNSRSDTVYLRLACWGQASVPGCHAERVDRSGRDVFIEQQICALGSSSVPPVIAVMPGATFVDTASLHVSEWVSFDPTYSQAAVVGSFRLVYDLCIARRAGTTSTTCDTLPRTQRVTNPFEVVAPSP
jgi:hypothetical protein